MSRPAGLLALAIANPIAAALIAAILVVLSLWLVFAARRALKRLLEPKRQRSGLNLAKGGISMPVSQQPLVERIARVLAGTAHSSNAEGSDPSAGEKIDLVWREHVDQALAVLHTMREPDRRMAAAGDPETWQRMVEASIAAAE